VAEISSATEDLKKSSDQQNVTSSLIQFSNFQHGSFNHLFLGRKFINPLANSLLPVSINLTHNTFNMFDEIPNET